MQIPFIVSIISGGDPKSPSSVANLKTLFLFSAPWIPWAPNSMKPSPWLLVIILPPSRFLASSTVTL